MEFRRRHNCYYATLTSLGSRDPVGVVTGTEIQSCVWLGTADRTVIRLIEGAESVLLDIESWRKTIIDPYERLPAGTYMVGARVPEGVIGVFEGGRPMLKRVAGEPDRLGREPKEETKEPIPWFRRTL